MSRKKLSDWAQEHGVHYRTALAWAVAGTLPAPVERTAGGHYRVVCDESVPPPSGRVVLYGRVSSSDQKADLARQMQRLASFASSQGYTDLERVEEIGSGLNGRRRKLSRLLADPQVRTIIVEHRDRLARFGVESLEAALAASGRSLVVLESGEQPLDIVQDFVDLVTSMCARIYGRRSASHRAQRAVAAAAEAP